MDSPQAHSKAEIREVPSIGYFQNSGSLCQEIHTRHGQERES